jgi:hypothetical protein
MQLTVIYEGNGNIAALIAYPLGSPPCYPEMKPGQQMVEIKAPAEITLDLDARQISKRLSDLMQNYRVEAETAKCRLTRKPDRT